LKASNDKTPFSIFEESKDKDIAGIGSQDFRKLPGRSDASPRARPGCSDSELHRLQARG
jgi:hypothetical protein